MREAETCDCNMREEKSMRSIRLIMRPWLSRAARRALVGRNRSRGAPEEGRFTRADVGRILDLTWQGFGALARALPREPTLGTRMMRSGTLAGGAACCDFRFRVVAPSVSRVEEPIASAASRPGAQAGAEPSSGGDHGAN
jgi:hypothetical protein